MKATMSGIKDAICKSGGFNVVGGSHSTSEEAIFSIAQLLQLKKDDIVWDIGVGKPKMAFFFSMVTQTPVVGTDVGKWPVHYTLLYLKIGFHHTLLNR
jgi:hypothetical protein